MKFEYDVFNRSDVEKRNDEVDKSGIRRADKKKLTWLDLMNERGADGWEIMFPLNKNSYLMKRRVEDVQS